MKKGAFGIAALAAVAVVAIIAVVVSVSLNKDKEKDEKIDPTTSVGAGYTQDDKTSEDYTTKPTVAASEEKTTNRSGEPTYIKGILIANKSYALPSDYNPGIQPQARRALNEMIAAAAEDNISLWIVSGFRSYQSQASIYDGYVNRDGVERADRYSARPGHSEHQTGLSFDLNSLDQSFGETEEGRWIKDNCHKYGFIIRYPEGKENVTGYMYEPWHVRYLGKSTAQKVYDSGLCLEEYLGIDSKYAD